MFGYLQAAEEGILKMVMERALSEGRFKLWEVGMR